MIYVLLECDATELVAEHDFFNLIWSDQLSEGMSKVICCGGNTNFEKEFQNLRLMDGDSIYIHYDILNTFEKRKRGLYVSLLSEIQHAKRDCNFDAYILNYMSFEHLILKTSVIKSLLECAKRVSLTQKRAVFISECLKCLEDLYARDAQDSFSLMDIRLLSRRFPLVFKDTLVTTREQYVSHVCDQLSKVGKRFFHCAKSTLGVCWKIDCTEKNHQAYCPFDAEAEFCTTICNTGARLSSILAALGLTDREQLYSPLCLQEIDENSMTLLDNTESKSTHFFT